MNRRHAVVLMSSFIATPAIARPGISLSMRNVMGESMTLRYYGHLSSTEHAAFSNLARDRRQNVSSPMDGALINILQGIAEESGQGGTFTILSGFRTPATNAILPGAAENSFHLRGQALDVYRDGMTIGEIAASLTQHSGGLGLYGSNGFVHIDTGPSRRWGDATSGLTSYSLNGEPTPERRRSIPSFTGVQPDLLQNAFKF